MSRKKRNKRRSWKIATNRRSRINPTIKRYTAPIPPVDSPLRRNRILQRRKVKNKASTKPQIYRKVALETPCQHERRKIRRGYFGLIRSNPRAINGNGNTGRFDTRSC